MSLVLLVGALAWAGPASARPQEAQTLSVDPRIRTIRFDPNHVVPLEALVGYQTMIAFGASERIEIVSIGDSASWQVTPDRRADLLFLKPLALRAPTNMTVVTNLHTYLFALTALDGGERARAHATFSLHFLYDEGDDPRPHPAPVSAPIENVDFNYSVAGARRLTPTRVFDDGARTYFQFPENVDMPAIFVIGDDGAEELANPMTRGRYVVVDRIADAFVLRFGRSSARVRRQALAQGPATSSRHAPAGR